MGGLFARGMGSESSAWTLIVVLAGIQLSFRLIPPPHNWTGAFYCALAVCVCLLGIGVALSTLETIPKRAVAIGFSVLLMSMSLTHLFSRRETSAVNIAEPVATSSGGAEDEEDENSDGTPVDDRPAAGELPVQIQPTRLVTYAPGVQVESRIDQLGGVYRLSWRVVRDGDSKRCGPLFMRGGRTAAETTLQTRVEATAAAAEHGDLICA